MNLKSIWSVVAGVLFIFAASTAVDIVLHVVGVYPPMGQPIGNGLALLATAYRFVIGIGGGWVTARLAPRNPMKHALILGGVGTVLALVGVAVTWNKDLGPKWFAISLVVLAIPQCWLGGRLFEARSAKS